MSHAEAFLHDNRLFFYMALLVGLTAYFIAEFYMLQARPVLGALRIFYQMLNSFPSFMNKVKLCSRLFSAFNASANSLKSQCWLHSRSKHIDAYVDAAHAVICEYQEPIMVMKRWLW